MNLNRKFQLSSSDALTIFRFEVPLAQGFAVGIPSLPVLTRQSAEKPDFWCHSSEAQNLLRHVQCAERFALRSG